MPLVSHGGVMAPRIRALALGLVAALVAFPFATALPAPALLPTEVRQAEGKVKIWQPDEPGLGMDCASEVKIDFRRYADGGFSFSITSKNSTILVDDACSIALSYSSDSGPLNPSPYTIEETEPGAFHLHRTYEWEYEGETYTAMDDVFLTFGSDTVHVKELYNGGATQWYEGVLRLVEPSLLSPTA